MSSPSGTLRIVLQRADDGISVDAPVEAIANNPERLAAHIARLQAQGYVILKSDATGADLPNERTGQSRRFRNQWRWDGASVEPELDLCRAQLLAEVRAERNARLADSDGEATRHLERGQPNAALADYREALRDLPARVAEAIQGLDDAAQLEAYVPPWPERPESIA